jgi:alkanesulfonate monooxygenase SsuD/methylene tetrahydromethanopterin reductase-like flavin-dependent oxidoreductase (luciferase family)
MEKITMGILDFGRRSKEMSGLARIEDVISLAVEVENTGFSHFWLGEHHTEETGLPWCNPDVLLPIIAGMTNTIKTGIAGTLILIHSPYSVACNYKLLANLFPGRIDLGVARGVPTSNTRIAETLTGQPFEMSAYNSRYTSRIEELLYYLRDEQAMLEEKIIIPPYKGDIPALWYLGAAFTDSLSQALDFEMDFCRSTFHGYNDLPVAPQQEKLKQFRDDFYKRYSRLPRINIAVSGVCMHNRDAAKKAVDERYADDGFSVIGTAEDVMDKVYEYQQLYDVNEFTFFSTAAHPEHILEGVQLLGKAVNTQVPEGAAITLTSSGN